MSRSQPENEVQINPCQRWFQWDGGDGKGLKEYNKETKKNEIVPLPFRFLVLDRLYTSVGYNEPEGIGYYSNEVRNIKDKLTVRSKNGIEAEGSWEEVKAQLGSKGLDFAQSVYIAYFDDNKKLTLGNIKMKGATLGPWFEFCKKNDIMKIGVTIKEAKEAKKGRTTYFEPVFSAMTIKDETNAAAVDIDKELQEYLEGYLKRNYSTVEALKAEVKAETTTEVKVEKTASKSADEPIDEFKEAAKHYTPDVEDDGLDLPF